MADREKVIKALEYCIGRNGCWSDDNHEECPWISKCREDSSSLKRDAIELLKEQEKIIRCKDCRHWIGGGIDDKDNFIPPRCTLFNELQTANWFCPAGQRKEEET